jgi:hypothetical protein
MSVILLHHQVVYACQFLVFLGTQVIEFIFLLEMSGGRRIQREVHQIGLNDMETKANLLHSAEKLAWDFCDSSFIFITVLNATIQCDPCHRNKICQTGHCRRLSHALIHCLAFYVTR